MNLCAEAWEKDQQIVAFGMFNDFIVDFVVELVHETVVYIAGFDLKCGFAEQVDYVVLFVGELTCIHLIYPRIELLHVDNIPHRSEVKSTFLMFLY